MTSNQYMVGNDDLLDIVHRVKPNFGMTKRRYSRLYIENSPLAPRQQQAVKFSALSAAVLASLIVFFGLCAWGMFMIIGGQGSHEINLSPEEIPLASEQTAPPSTLVSK